MLLKRHYPPTVVVQTSKKNYCAIHSKYNNQSILFHQKCAVTSTHKLSTKRPLKETQNKKIETFEGETITNGTKKR